MCMCQFLILIRAPPIFPVIIYASIQAKQNWLCPHQNYNYINVFLYLEINFFKKKNTSINFVTVQKYSYFISKLAGRQKNKKKKKIVVVPPITKYHYCLFNLTKEIDWTPSNSLNPKLVHYLKWNPPNDEKYCQFIAYFVGKCD